MQFLLTFQTWPGYAELSSTSPVSDSPPSCSQTAQLLPQLYWGQGTPAKCSPHQQPLCPASVVLVMVEEPTKQRPLDTPGHSAQVLTLSRLNKGSLCLFQFRWCPSPDLKNEGCKIDCSRSEPWGDRGSRRILKLRWTGDSSSWLDFWNLFFFQRDPEK